MSPATTGAQERSVRDVMHDAGATLPADATIADARSWFAASASRRLALVADRGRYLGALTRAELPAPDETVERVPARTVARPFRTVAPDAPAAIGRELALHSSVRRVPVVEEDGTLVGVLALTLDGTAFACRAPG